MSILVENPITSNFDDFLLNKINLVQEKLKEYNEKKSSKKFKNISKKIINKYWFEFIKETQKEKLMELIIEFLPENLYNIFKEYAVLIEYSNYKLTEHSQFDFLFNNMMKTNTSKKKIAQVIDYLKSDPSIKSIFDEIKKITSISSSVNTLIVGRSGIGKTTLSCITEGFYSSLNNSIPKSRCISNNGRGTVSFEKINLQIQNTDLNVYDFIGFSDPGLGFDNKRLFNNLLNELKKNSCDSKINLDSIIYGLDLSIPRLDINDYNFLEMFMTQMSKVYDNLEYWKSVIIVCTKANLIKLKEYEKFGGLPEYKISKFKKENKLPMNKDTIKKYNRIYRKELIKVMELWKLEIKNRIFCKIFDGRICQDDNGQSFNIYFKIIAKKIYPTIEEKYLDNVIKNLNYVVIGDAEKNPNSKIWDYRNCKIKPLPNFDDSINEFYEDFEFDIDKKSYTYDFNWFTTLQNKLYNISNSESFKLTISKLNLMKIKE